MIPELGGDFIQWLRGFYFVATTGSVSSAAEEMGLRQPAVSYQIKCLEESLHCRLFTRSGGRMKITAEGRVLLEKTVAIFDMIKELHGTFAENADHLKGQVNLVTTHAVILYLMPSLLAEFQKLYPSIQVEISGGGLRTIFEMITSGQADFGIAGFTEPPPKFHYQELFTTQLSLICSKTDPLAELTEPSLAQIADRPFIAFPESSTITPTVREFFAKHGLRLNIAHMLNHFELVKKFVEYGLGVAILDDYALGPDDQERLKIFPLTGTPPKRSYGLIRLKKKYLPAPTTALLDFISRFLADRNKMNKNMVR